MPMKQPQPFFRKSAQSWNAPIYWKQIPLGTDRENALAKYHALILGRQPIEADISVRQILGMRLTWCEGNRKISSAGG